MMIRLAVAATLALSTQAFAQECIISYDQLLDDIEQSHGTIVGGATYQGYATVEMVIVDIHGQIVMFGVDRKGCLFGQIIVEASVSGAKART